MVIIRVHGGLGNQMFQYALFITFRKLGKEVKLDISDNIEYLKGINQTDVFNVFGITGDDIIADQDEIAGVKVIRQDIVAKFYRKLSRPIDPWYFEAEEGKYDSKVCLLKDAYIDGYWQTEKYFGKYRKELLDVYRFKNNLSDECRKVLEQIYNCTCSVSVHIRMGDYLKEINKELYGNICTEDYYGKAIGYMNRKYQDASFFFFSDDKEYLDRYLDKDNCYIVACSDSYSAWVDMFLMSRCRHNIIANSSFSWWGAWLNTYEGKEVIAPRQWINGKNMPDICPENWIRM